LCVVMALAAPVTVCITPSLFLLVLGQGLLVGIDLAVWPRSWPPRPMDGLPIPRIPSQCRLMMWLAKPPTSATAKERLSVDAGRRCEEDALLFEGGFTFRNFVADAFAIFMFVLWFWLFVSVASDLFRRHDISGWAKVLWVIALILFSYIGIFAYILTQGRGMAERNQARAQQARDELRQVAGFSPADEIEKLNRLKSAGSIFEQEYARLRARVIGGSSVMRSG